MRIGGHTYCLKKDHRRQSVNTKGTSSNTDKEMTLDDIEITFQKKTPSVPTAKSNEVRFNQFLFNIWRVFLLPDLFRSLMTIKKKRF